MNLFIVQYRENIFIKLAKLFYFIIRIIKRNYFKLILFIILSVF
jgi:hypothetical protein